MIVTWMDFMLCTYLRSSPETLRMAQTWDAWRSQMRANQVTATLGLWTKELSPHAGPLLTSLHPLPHLRVNPTLFAPLTTRRTAIHPSLYTRHHKAHALHSAGVQTSESRTLLYDHSRATDHDTSVSWVRSQTSPQPQVSTWAVIAQVGYLDNPLSPQLCLNLQAREQ